MPLAYSGGGRQPIVVAVDNRSPNNWRSEEIAASHAVGAGDSAEAGRLITILSCQVYLGSEASRSAWRFSKLALSVAFLRAF